MFPVLDNLHHWMQNILLDNLLEVGRILFIYRKNSTKKDKENKTKENYVQRTTIYNNYIGTQQINSSGTAYLLMC